MKVFGPCKIIRTSPPSQRICGAFRMTLNPDRSMTTNMAMRPTKAGCAAACPKDPLQVLHDQPSLKPVYGCGVYRANRSALFGAIKPGLLGASDPLSSQTFKVHMACGNGVPGLSVWYL